MPPIRRPQRRPFLIVVDGASEQGYFQWLDRIAKDQKHDIHLNVDTDGSGGPPATLERARRLTAPGRKYAEIPKSQVIIIVDRETRTEAEMQPFREDCAKARFKVFVQDPCFEGWLLAHFVKSEYRLGLSCPKCAGYLKKRWTGNTSATRPGGSTNFASCWSA